MNTIILFTSLSFYFYLYCLCAFIVKNTYFCYAQLCFKMKKCISLFVAILLFINSGGFIILFYQLQQHVKKEILSSIREGEYNVNEVARFVLSKKDLNKNVNGYVWENAHEFKYRGRLYDIINISYKNDTAYLNCVNDITEEKLVKSFNDEVNQLASGKLNSSKIKTSLINLISQALLKNSSGLSLWQDNRRFPDNFVENILLSESKIPTPPPRLT